MKQTPIQGPTPEEADRAIARGIERDRLARLERAIQLRTARHAISSCLRELEKLPAPMQMAVLTALHHIVGGAR